MNITELLYNLAEPFMALSEQNQIRYDLDIAPEVIGMVDKDKLEKIIFNLLSNAFKYSGKNEQVVFIANESTINRELEIWVSNSGIELSKEQLAQLFDQFYVALKNNLRSDKFGTGIGLAFTKQLVTMLNGKISASAENGCITFKVVLPLHIDDRKVPVNKNIISGQPSYLYQIVTTYNESDHSISTRENNKDAIMEDLLVQDREKVLVVEDKPEIRFLLKDILKDDYIVYEAEDGQEALSLVTKILPDIVICDVMMPNMNGLELCNKMKNNTAVCHIPFILLSARGSEEHHIEGYEVGADAYIAKPFNVAHLKVRVRKLLEYHQKLHDNFKSNSSSDLHNETEVPNGDKEFLTRLVQVIEDNLDEPALSDVFLEKQFCLSKMQLYRKLKTLTGMTPGEFIKYLRLKASARLLTTTQLNVSEIFYKSGFNNQSYFFREFKKKYKCAPKEYREQNIARQ